MIQIDEAARHLDGSALKLYVRLLGIGVAMRTCSVEISDRWLCTELNMAYDTLTEAKRQIVRFIHVDTPKGLPTRYQLPLPWLTPQQPMLFSTGAPNSGALVLRNLGHRAPNSGALVHGNLGHTAPENGAGCPNNWGTVHGNLGHTAPESGAPSTEDEGVSGKSAPENGAPLIRSESDLKGLSVVVVNQIIQVALVEKVRTEDKEVATLLSLDLQSYMAAYPYRGSSPEPKPAERILARCLQIADLETLRQTLKTLANEGRRGRKYAWFVTVFLQKIHGIAPELTASVFKHVLEEKKAEIAAGPLLRDTILDALREKTRRVA